MPDRILELLLENAWVVETLKALGSGHMLHLSFAFDQVAPDTLADMESGALGPGALGEIAIKGADKKRVATIELQRINWQKGFIRLDFRLLSVAPFERDGDGGNGRPYLCRYREERGH